MESIFRIINAFPVIHHAKIVLRLVQTVQLVHLESIYRQIPVLHLVHQLTMVIRQQTLATFAIQLVLLVKEAEQVNVSRNFY
jgi:hypothetical protein